MNKIKFIFKKLSILPTGIDLNKQQVTAMKTTLTILIIISTILITGCVSSGNTTNDVKEKIGASVEVHNPNLGLDEYLRRLSGVRV